MTGTNRSGRYSQAVMQECSGQKKMVGQMCAKYTNVHTSLAVYSGYLS